MSLLACNKTNPLIDQPATPFGVPAFDQVKLEHYMPAFEEAIRQDKAGIDAIANNTEAPITQRHLRSKIPSLLWIATANCWSAYQVYSSTCWRLTVTTRWTL